MKALALAALLALGTASAAEAAEINLTCFANGALVAGGIGADRLKTQGFGQTKPVAPNDTDLGRAQNRRVEVVRP